MTAASTVSTHSSTSMPGFYWHTCRFLDVYKRRYELRVVHQSAKWNYGEGWRRICWTWGTAQRCGVDRNNVAIAELKVLMYSPIFLPFDMRVETLSKVLSFVVLNTENGWLGFRSRKMIMGGSEMNM